ncbi:hypothetical protein LTS18_010663 [Coniosporium uncinatum]|uniref:Uncharacterized protein n=1 Tax=Coniosporium uncinatum TaxID=93489 RepID=A0ACC3DZK9_9PEZI|nr:hypothetical protein LTS18_010663 [Coniosporium uncinatum]
MPTLSRHSFEANGHTTSYLEAGPPTGPLLIFVHGWPDIALTWKHQLMTFASLGFRAVAADTRGYGESSVPKDRHDYRVEYLVADQIALLHHLEREQAVWIGHDWGSGIVWALAAQHPEVCAGVVNLCVPGQVLEYGLDKLVSLVNRELYPKDKYPYGQWEYMKYYELHPDESDEQFAAGGIKIIKALCAKGDPASYGKPSITATVVQDGGWFGGKPDQLPDIPLEATVLDQDVFEALAKDKERNGWFPATSYYLNHDLNNKYMQNAPNGGYLEMPVFYIDAKYDGVCSPSTSPRLAEPMRKHCKKLTESTIEGMHWVHMEKPDQVNAALASWLATTLPKYWPYHYKNPVVA